MNDSLPAAWTNYGPLTSIFTPPADCNVLTISSTTQKSSTTSYDFPQPTTLPQLHIFDPATATSCFPSQYPTYQTPVTSTITVDSTVSTVFPTATSAYFSPGRCPKGWETQILTFTFIPDGHTLAACCPTAIASSGISHRDLEKRRGTRPKKKTTTSCGFELPTRTGEIQGPITDSAQYYNSIVALANGSLTTMAAADWFSMGGLSARTVHATGVNVMWKRGDFPDIDKAADKAKASASASNAAVYSGGSHSHTNPAATIGIVVPVCSVVFCLIVFGTILWRMKRARKGPSGTTGVFMALRKRFVDAERADAAPAGKRPRDGLLGAMRGATAGAAFRDPSPATEKTQSRSPRDDDIESARPVVAESVLKTAAVDESPPPYGAGESSSNPSGSAAASNTRMWNETNLEYEHRRLQERKELLIEKMKIAREEDILRARMREQGP